jgi:hypothetical protein
MSFHGLCIQRHADHDLDPKFNIFSYIRPLEHAPVYFALSKGKTPEDVSSKAFSESNTYLIDKTVKGEGPGGHI